MALFLGLLSGTSADAIDAVIADFSYTPPRIIAASAYPFPADFRAQVLTLSQNPAPILPAQLAQLDVRAGHLFAQAACSLLQQANISPHQICALGCHGQTLYHDPHAVFPYTWQIGDPHVIAYQTGITTVADFRRRDIAAGGQGAPLAPLFHNAMLRVAGETRGVLNIGGIANLTVLPSDPTAPLIGFDCGPGNALLDAWAQQCLGQAMDAQGAWAAQGQVDAQLLARWRQDAYFHRPAPKSSGRDYFNLARFHPSAAKPVDIQATLVALTVESAAEAMRSYALQRVLICGGGVHNPLLIKGLQIALPHCTVQSSAELGIDPDWMEALCFAWLAQQRLNETALDCCSITGAQRPQVLGGLFASQTPPRSSSK
jgi:anhydro-N-acetylmuramic acid kinase